MLTLPYSTPSALSEEIHALHANLCAALADPTRIMLLYCLAEGPRTVNQLAVALDIGQSAASRHLKTLRERDLVRAVRQGTCVEYYLGDERLIQALDLLRGVLQDTLMRRASLVDAADLSVSRLEEL